MAQNFTLVDRDGDERARLVTSTDNEVGANFYDAQGNARIVFAVYNEGNAIISLTDNDQKERTRLLLQLDPESNGPEVHMVDEAGSPEIVLTQVGGDRANPSPMILVREPDGRFREV